MKAGITLTIPFAKKPKDMAFDNRAKAQSFVNDQFGTRMITKKQWNDLTDALGEPMASGMSKLRLIPNEKGDLAAILQTP